MGKADISKRHVGIGTFRANDRMRVYINDILESGRISYGKYSKEFERTFAELHESRHAILSNSGTSSLHVALQALKELHHWKDGDEVIVPATTFVATPNVVIHNKMKPVFVDVDPETFNINTSLIPEAITDRTRAIIPVHLFGQPADMTAVNEIADYEGLFVIEDSCETMFAKHNGKSVGHLGHIGCFSLYMAHILTAGVGGVSTTDDPEYAKKMRSLVNHGLSVENLNPGENYSPRFMINRRFEFVSAGHSFRITEFEAAVALAQCAGDPIYTIVAPRNRNARHLAKGIETINKIHNKRIFTTQKTLAVNTHSWMMFPIVIEDDAVFTKEEIMGFLNDWEIETRDMLPILNQPFYSSLSPLEYPVSAKLIDRGFYIGCHQGLQPADISYVIQQINMFVEEKERNVRKK